MPLRPSWCLQDSPKALVDANDAPTDIDVGGATVTIQFTRTSQGSDMAALRSIIESVRDSILFLVFTPGAQGLHTLAAERANDRHMYLRGVVSTLGNAKGDTDRNVLDILLSSDQKFKPDRFKVVQPQGEGNEFGSWIAEVTRRDFLSQVGHAIAPSKVLVIDPLSDDPVVVTGSHNFSAPASERNDETLVIVRGHPQLARAYATAVMSVSISTTASGHTSARCWRRARSRGVIWRTMTNG